MLTTSSRDNWERLVVAVLKRDQIWQLCHQDSITTISSDFSQQIISSTSNSLRPPSPQLPLTNDSALGKMLLEPSHISYFLLCFGEGNAKTTVISTKIVDSRQ